jgi:hypothetical protein
MRTKSRRTRGVSLCVLFARRAPIVQLRNGLSLKLPGHINTSVIAVVGGLFTESAMLEVAFDMRAVHRHTTCALDERQRDHPTKTYMNYATRNQ